MQPLQKNKSAEFLGSLFKLKRRPKARILFFPDHHFYDRNRGKIPSGFPGIINRLPNRANGDGNNDKFARLQRNKPDEYLNFQYQFIN